MQVKTDPREKMRACVLQAGGLIEDEIFVTEPGAVILSRTAPTESARSIYKNFNIDTSRPDYEQRAEFSSRITYMAFRDEAVDGSKYNERMAREFQHLSVHSAQVVEFFIAGISIETSLELCAHGEARVGRLTSSKTKAMDETLYRLQGSVPERARQKAFILDFLKLRERFDQEWDQEDLGSTWREYRNMLNVPTKVTAMSYTMTLKDFHKLFIGRLSPHGNEQEVQEICCKMCTQLHELYPLVIRTPDEYYDMNNGEKYR